MKPTKANPFRFSSPILAAISVAFIAQFAAPTASATPFYWDTNAATAGFGTAVSGTWAQNSTTAGRWSTDAAGAISGSLTQTTTNADTFNFGTGNLGLGATTITVSGSVTMGSTTYGLASGAIVLTGGTINFSAAPTIAVNNTTDTINSVIGAGGAATSFTKSGTGTLVLGGANTFTGSTIISAGTINLGGGTANGSLASSALTLGGGNLNYTRTGSTTQSFTTTNITSGVSAVSAVSGNILNLGTISRTGGTIDFSSVGAGTVAALGGSNVNGIIPGATFGSTWAVANGAGVAISGLVSGSYTSTSTAGTTAGNYTNINIDVDNSAGLLDGVITPSSLRFNTAGANIVTLAAGANAINSGILVTSAVGNNLSTISGGNLTGAASSDLVISQQNTSNGLTISSAIVNNTATGLIKVGAGLLTLSNTNTYSGTTTVSAGTLALSAANTLSGATSVASSATLQLGSATSMGSSTTTLASGATLQLRNDNTTTFTAPIATPAAGAGVTYNLDVNNAGSAVTGKTLTLAGTLTFGNASANTLNITGGNSYALALGTLSAPSGSGGPWNFTINATTAPATVAKFSAGSFGSALVLQGGNAITLTNFEMGSNGSNSITVNGAGTVATLGTTTQTNTRAGGNVAYNLTGGTLNLTATTSLANIRAASGTISAPTFTISGGTLDNTGSSALTLAASPGTGTVAGSPNITLNGNFAFTGTKDLNLGAGTVSLGTTAGTSRTITANGGNLTIGGIISNGTTANGLTKSGAGTLTLTNTSAYTGATVVNGGTLALTGSGAINTSSGITVNGSGAKLLQTSSTATTPAVTLTSGTVTGNGTVNTVNVGAGTGGIISNNNGVAGAVLTVGALTFNGAATVNTYSDSASAPVATTSLATNAAGDVTLNPTAASWTDGTPYDLISYSGGSVGGAGSSKFILGTVSGKTARQIGVLGDSGTAITLTLSGNDTPYWTGDGDDTWNLTSTNNWNLLSNNTATTFLANDVALFNDNATGAGPIAVNIDVADVATNSTTFNNSSKDYVLSGAFGISSGSLTKSGAGKVTINTTNSYAGGTTVSGGTLVLGNASAIGTGTLTLNGGNLDSSVADLVNAGNNVQTWNSDFTFVGTQSLNLGTGAVTLSADCAVTVSANTLTIGGALGGGGFALTKLGAGTLNLKGTNTFTGPIAVNAGTLALSPAGALTCSNTLTGTGTLNANPGTTNLILNGDLSGFSGTINVAAPLASPGKLNTGNSSLLGAGTVVNISNGGTWFFNAATQTGITVNVSGTGNAEGFGALRTDTGTIDSTSSVVMQASSSIGGVTTTNTGTINAVISENVGPFALTKVGTNNIALGGANTYTGLTTVSTGSLILKHANALGTTAAGTTVANAARVELDNITVTGEAITLIGNGTNFLGALQGRSGTSVWAGNVLIDSPTDTRIGAAAGASLEVSGAIDDGVNDYRILYRVADTAASVIISGANTYTGGTSIAGTGPVIASSLNKVVGGNPTSNFGAPVTEANGMLIIGTTTVGGTLRYAGAGETTDRTVQIGANSATPVVGDTGGAGIEANGTTALTFSAPTFNTPTNAVTGTSPTRTLTLGGTNANANTVSGIIQNNQIAGSPTAAVALTKSGTGSWTLAGNNTYTGLTTVADGILTLTGNRTVAPVPTPGLDVGGTGSPLATLNVQGDLNMGASQYRLGVNGPGTVNQTAGTTSFTSGSQLTVGVTAAMPGIYNLSGGILSTASQTSRGVILGVNSNCTGTFNLSGSSTLTMAAGSVMQIGRSESSSTVTGSTGTFNQTGGATVATVGELRMGGGNASNSGTTATLELSAGTFSAATFTNLSAGSTSSSTINISGTADVTLPAFPASGLGSGSTATITFNGGTLKNTATSANYLGVVTEALIKAGGARFDTTNGDITLTQDLLTDGISTGGGLTKAGSNTLTLGGTTITYTGNTVVNAGTLAISTSYLANAADVSIAVGASMALNYAGTDAVDELTIDGVAKSPGTYGATGSGATNIDDVHFTGTGTLTVTTGPSASAYASWATAKGLDDSDAAHSSAKSADPDGDGKNNLYEFAFDGNPLSGATDGKVVGRIATVGADQVLTLTLPVRTGATFSGSPAKVSALIDGVYYRVEGANDLTTFTDTITEVTGGDATTIQTGLPTLTTGWTYRTFRVSGTVPTVSADFLRAKVSETP